MALRRWHRIGLTAACMVLAAALVLPPRPQPEGGDSGWQWGVLLQGSVSSYPRGRGSYERTLSGTIANLKINQRAARLTDTLFALAAGARALRSADRAVTLVYATPMTADTAHVWLGLMERELALAPRGPGGGMPVIVRLRVARDRAGQQRLDDWRVLRFVSPRPERPACLIDVRLNDLGGTASGLVQRVRSGLARSRVLGWCMLYARFGMPGARVERWAGRRADAQYWWGFGPDLGWVLDVHRRGREREEMAGWWWDKLSGACSRDGGPCLRTVGLVDDPNLGWEGAASVRRGSLLAGLMLRDSARFERFWRSPEYPAEALERAYGRPAGLIIADWRKQIVGTELDWPGRVEMSALDAQYLAPSGSGPGGPRMPAGALLTALGWVVVAIGLGMLVAWRQQVRS